MALRTRGFLLKVIFAIPVVWFFIFFIMIVTMNYGDDDSTQHLSQKLNPLALFTFSQNQDTHPLKFKKKFLAKMHENELQEAAIIPAPGDDVDEDAVPGEMVLDLFKKKEYIQHDVHEEAVVFQHEDKNILESIDVNTTRFTIPPIDNDGPGARNQMVKMNDKTLPEKELAEWKRGWKQHQFNLYASDRVSLRRTMPDYRNQACKEEGRFDPGGLQTSVIICFHNEAWSTLLRTIFSVLDRSPPALIKEIILVDDFSDMDHLKKPLEDYLTILEKVKVLRTTKREGLIRARLKGAAVATGEVLVYLDSHCECLPGWLEPLLDRIHTSESNVVVPVIDALSDDTLKLMFQHEASIGGFDWDLLFNWHSIPKREKDRRTSSADPIRSPTMAGGLFAIRKDYFEKLGTYDPGFDIWGGENLELSFKTWMCGGQLEIHPCSHVGHIYRKKSPYSWGNKGASVLKINLFRLAMVWMDDYAQYYLDYIGNKMIDYGDISSRVALRKNLQCNNFDWYMKNVFPELFVPANSVAKGAIKLGADDQRWCLDAASHQESKVTLGRCHGTGSSQFFMLSPVGQIRRSGKCIDAPADGRVIMYACHTYETGNERGTQSWQYETSGLLVSKLHNKCLEARKDGKRYKDVTMSTCDSTNSDQLWLWNRVDASSQSV